MSSLYERLGGQEGLDKAVDIFYRKVLMDDRISQFFEDTDMDVQAAKQKAFLTMVTGGPNNYTGKNMRDGHTDMVKRGLNDSHVDAVVELLVETLREVGAPEADIQTVVSVCEGARNDVLNRDAAPAQAPAAS